MNTQEFIATVLDAVPTLAASLQEDEGLFSLQLGTFANHVQSLIDGGASEELKLCFSLVERALRTGDPTLINLVGVAFLEHLNFVDGKRHRSWALHCLQPLSIANLQALGRYPKGGKA